MNQLNRRSFLAGMAGLAALQLATESSFAAGAQLRLMFAGTYPDPKDPAAGSKGIYAYQWDSGAGTLHPLGLAAESARPSFQALSPDRRTLYSVNEITNYGGANDGSVSAYSVDSATGMLTLKNVVSSGGAGPVNIKTDQTGKAAFVADYNGGALASYRVLADGSLSAPVSHFQFTGHSVDPRRQTGPHTHCVTVSPDNRYVLANDLGLDRIMVFRINVDTAELTPNDPPFYTTLPGSGPRSLAFHPNRRWAYSLSEMATMIEAMSWDTERGTLTRFQSISGVPQGFTGKASGATVQVDLAGRFLYASIRGSDTIAVFSIRAADGTLEEVQQISCGGQMPRFFALDPTNRWLLSANQNSGNIAVLARNPKTGLLTATNNQYEIGAPVCLTFA
jgi:6-phosphogluconolactonase